MNLKLYTNDLQSSQTPEGRMFAELWNACLEEYRREFCYMADMASLDFSHSLGHGNINFSWSGNNSSIPNFIQETVRIMNDFREAESMDIFNDKKEVLLQKYKNHYLQ